MNKGLVLPEILC